MGSRVGRRLIEVAEAKRPDTAGGLHKQRTGKGKNQDLILTNCPKKIYIGI
jgi:hypothetical protein